MTTKLSVMLLSLTLLSAAAIAQWQPTPVGIPTLTRLISSADGEQLLLGTGAAGLWQSMDGGLHWLPRSEAFPGAPDGPITTLARDDMTGLRIVAGITDGSSSERFYHTLDGGATWAEIEYPTASGDIVISRGNSSHWLYAGTFNTEISYTSGTQWMYIPSDLPAVEKLVHDPLADSIVYALNVADVTEARSWWDHVYRTTDFGQSWSTVFAGDSTLGLAENTLSVASITRSASGILWITAIHYAEGATRPVLIVSVNGGASWQIRELTPSLPELEVTEMDILEDREHPGTLLLAGRMTGGVARSTDNGLSWTSALAGLPSAQVSGSRLAQNAAGGPLFVLLDDYGLYRTTNGGQSWQTVNLPPIGAPAGDFAVTAAGTVFWAYRQWWDAPRSHWQMGTDGNTWEPLAPLPALPDTMVLENPVLFGRSDTLLTWLFLIADDGAGDYTGCMVLSTNRGSTWTRGPLWADPPSHIHAVSLEHGVALFAVFWYENALVRSLDLGQTWETNLPLFGANVSVWSSGPGGAPIWLLQDTHPQPTLYRSLDAGDNWTQVALPGSGPLDVSGTELHAVDSDLVVVTDGLCLRWHEGVWDTTGTLLPSESQGGTVLVPGSPSLLLDLIGDTYGTNSGVWLSRDLGATWQNLLFSYPFPLSEQNQQLRDLSYDPYRQRVWVSAGIGPCYFDLAALAVDHPHVALQLADYTVLECYPNPFNNTTRIRYDLPQPGRVELTLYDLQGRRVKTLVDESVGAGRHEVRAEGNGLASGTYFVSLRTAFGTHTEKLLLLK